MQTVHGFERIPDRGKILRVTTSCGLFGDSPPASAPTKRRTVTGRVTVTNALQGATVERGPKETTPRRLAGSRGTLPPMVIGFAAVHGNPFRQGGELLVAQERAFEPALNNGLNVLGVLDHDVSRCVAEVDRQTLFLFSEPTGLLVVAQPDDGAQGWRLADALAARGTLPMSLHWKQLRSEHDYHYGVRETVERVRRVGMLAEVSFLLRTDGANPVSLAGTVEYLAGLDAEHFRRQLTRTTFAPTIEELRAHALARLVEVARTIRRRGLAAFTAARRAARPRRGW